MILEKIILRKIRSFLSLAVASFTDNQCTIKEVLAGE